MQERRQSSFGDKVDSMAPDLAIGLAGIPIAFAFQKIVDGRALEGWGWLYLGGTALLLVSLYLLFVLLAPGALEDLKSAGARWYAWLPVAAVAVAIVPLTLAGKCAGCEGTMGQYGQFMTASVLLAGFLLAPRALKPHPSHEMKFVFVLYLGVVLGWMTVLTNWAP